MICTEKQRSQKHVDQLGSSRKLQLKCPAWPVASQASADRMQNRMWLAACHVT